MRFKVPEKQPKGFRASARYLAGQTKRHDRHDVLWAEERELGTTDPGRAAALMELTAQKSARVKQAPLHFIISFDPKDAAKGDVSPDVMREIAGSMIDRLGLGGHQMLIYAHRDKSHPHIHFLANRVHPETGKAWSHRNIGIRLKDACRDIAVERGLNVLNDRAQERTHGREDTAGPPTDADYRLAKRHGRDPEQPFNARTITQLRAILSPAFRDAKSWQDISHRLTERGLVLRAKGQGLILTDGDGYAKLSQMGRSVRLRELESRFGERFADFHAREAAALVGWAEEERRPFDDLPPGLSDEARVLAEKRLRKGRESKTDGDAVLALDRADVDYRNWDALEQSVRAGEYRIAHAQRAVQRGEQWQQRLENGTAAKRETFVAALAGLVADVGRAHENWTALEREHGVDAAARMIGATPALLGDPNAAQDAQRAADKSWKALVRDRKRWRAANKRLADARRRAGIAHQALARARADFANLKHGVGSPQIVRRHLLEKVRIRARALDRVNVRMLEGSQLSEIRLAQLRRAWRKHDERRRARERGRELARTR